MRRAWAIFAAVAFFGFGGKAFATPSTQIWIPSTDVQAYGVVHFGADTYNTLGEYPTYGTAPTQGAGRNVINYGLTVGVLPPSMSETLGLEVGIDYRDVTGNQHDPMYYNLKLGLKEGDLPAIALGVFDYGSKGTTGAPGDANYSGGTDYNIMYGLVAKTFGDLGRLSVGYYSGNDKLLGYYDNGTFKKDASGLLASWDKTLSDKWWAAIDYMGGSNSYGFLSFGICYYLTPNASMIFGYDVANKSDLDPSTSFKDNANTFTFQLDVNFSVFDGTAEHPHHD